MAETTREQIASRLRTARQAAGLTQGQAARLLKMHRPTISEIEAGRRRTSGEELIAFAELYAVTVEWLTSTSEHASPAEDRIILAARELSKMKDEDLGRLVSLLQMLRKKRGPK